MCSSQLFNATLVIFLLIFLASSTVIRSDFQTDMTFIKVCNKSSPIAMNTMNHVLIDKRLPHDLSAESHRQFKCFLHCLFEKYGWMDEDGGFAVHRMRSMLEETGTITVATMNYVMYGCTNQESMDKCQRAFMFIQCFWRKTDDEQREQQREREREREREGEPLMTKHSGGGGNIDEGRFYYSIDSSHSNSNDELLR